MYKAICKVLTLPWREKADVGESVVKVLLLLCLQLLTWDVEGLDSVMLAWVQL